MAADCIITDPAELEILRRAIKRIAAGQEPDEEFSDLALKAHWRRVTDEAWRRLWCADA